MFRIDEVCAGIPDDRDVITEFTPSVDVIDRSWMDATGFHIAVNNALVDILSAQSNADGQVRVLHREGATNAMLNTVEIDVPKHAVKRLGLQLADLTAADIRWNRADATVWRAVGAAGSRCGGQLVQRAG